MDKRLRWLLIGIATLTVAAGLILYPYIPQFIETAKEWANSLRTVLTVVPLWLYALAFAILPSLGFPLTFFYLSTPLMIENVALAIVFALSCVLVNSGVTYALGRYLVRSWANRLLERRSVRIPEISANNENSINLLVRASPIPWLLQNLVLAIGGVRFIPYLFWTLIIQSIAGSTFIIGGDSALDGNWMIMFAAAATFAAVSLGFSTWRKKNGKPRKSSVIPCH